MAVKKSPKDKPSKKKSKASNLQGAAQAALKGSKGMLAEIAAVAMVAGPIAKAATRLGLTLLSPQGIQERGKAGKEAKVFRAEARRQEALIDRQTKLDLERMTRGELRWDGKKLVPVPERGNKLLENEAIVDSIVAPPSSMEEMVQLATLIEEVEKVKKLLALRDVVRLAEEMADTEGQVTGESIEIDESLLMEFKDGAERSPEGVMRQLWARLLFAETKTPGSQTKRAIAALRLFSHEDADIVSRMGPLIVAGKFLIRPDSIFSLDNKDKAIVDAFKGQDLLQRNGLTPGNITHLGAIGILTGVQATGYEVTMPLQEVGGLKYWVVTFGDRKSLFAPVKIPRCELRFPVVELTTVGKQIIALGKFEPNPMLISAVADYISLHRPEWIGLYDLSPNGEFAIKGPHQKLYEAPI